MLSEQSLNALNNLPAVLSIGDLATILKCSKVTIRRLIWKGQLTAFYTDEGWMIYRGDFISYLSKHSNL
jgi:hypothetical protein